VTETNQLKLQLSNIASQLQASKDTLEALNAYIPDVIAMDDEVKRNLQMQETENKLLLGQLSDLSVKIQASKDEGKALLTQNRTLEEHELFAPEIRVSFCRTKPPIAGEKVCKKCLPAG
jgi:hypothetical protein